jgi:RsiW-degrading membrane proteinase PrsW (M82 family)
LAQAPLALLALAFLPPLLYLAGLALRRPGRSAGSGLLGFAYGATMSLGVLALMYLLVAALLGDPTRLVQAVFPERGLAPGEARDFALIVVVAPLMEELAKGFGVWLLGARLATGRDGVFLGAAVGLGFSATETFGYLLAASAQPEAGPALPVLGIAVGVLFLAGARAVTSAFVHPAATGLTGYGVGRAKAAGHAVLAGALPFYLLAAALHGAYNYLAAFLPPVVVAGFPLEVNFLAAWLVASTAWAALKGAVRGRR